MPVGCARVLRRGAFAWAFALVLAALLCGCGDGGAVAPSPTRTPPPAPLTKVTLAALKQVPDERLELALMAHIDQQIGPDREKASEALPKLPKGMRMLYATWVMEAQVGEGGFNQYFWNTSGTFAPQALEGLTAFGSVHYANVLTKAIDIEKQEAQMMRAFKEKGTPEAFAESYNHTKLKTLDVEYKGISENLSALRIRYIRAHPDEFVTE